MFPRCHANLWPKFNESCKPWNRDRVEVLLEVQNPRQTLCLVNHFEGVVHLKVAVKNAFLSAKDRSFAERKETLLV